MYPKTVMLDYASKEFYVHEAGYAAIKDLIRKYQICGKCRQPIDSEGHLLVGKNLGLSCLLKAQSSLRFLGPISVDDEGDYTYSFVDDNDIIYTATANHSEQAMKDTFSSITRAGFPLPEYYAPFKGDKDAPIKLGRYNWTTYGKLSQSVIVAEYNDRYPDIKALFLLYKGGEAKELTKRNSTHKQLFERARQIIESTRHGHGYYYHPDGHEISQIYNSTLYPVIAQLEAAVWDIQLQFMPKQEALPLIVEENQEVNLRQEGLLEDKEDVNQTPVSVENVIGELNPEENQATETSVPSTEEEQPKRSRRGRLSLVSPDAAEEKRIEENNAQSVAQPEKADEGNQTTD